MRSRTTAAFVLIIGVVLLACIGTLMAQAITSGEYESTQVLKRIAEEGRDAMQHPDWKQRLEAIAASPDVAQKDVTIVVRGWENGPPPLPTPQQRDNPSARPIPPVLWKSRSAIPPLRPRGNRTGVDTPEQKKWDATWRNWAEGAGHYRFISVYRPFSGFLTDMRRRRNDMLYLAGLVVLVVGAGAWFVVGRTLSPIRKLALQAAQASAEDLDTRLQAPSNDAEVVELVTTLNEFLKRMSDTAASKGRFYAAASHELRTPLQALSGHLELALSRDRSASEYKSALEEAQRQSSRLKSLVQSLLLLHQLENTEATEQEEVDLLSLTNSTLRQLHGLIEAKHVEVGVSVPEDATICSVTNHADILVRNLLENAIKYTNGEVRISATISPMKIDLEVFNECEEMPDWVPDKAMEAFFRPDFARNSKTGGNGLGLAICRAIARVNGWDLKIGQVDGGFLAQVVFPSGTPTPPTRGRERPARKPISGVAESKPA